MDSFTNNSLSVQTKSFQQRKHTKSYRSALTCTKGFPKERTGAMKKSDSIDSLENFKGALKNIKKSVSLESFDMFHDGTKQEPPAYTKSSRIKKSSSTDTLGGMMGSLSNIKKSISLDRLHIEEKDSPSDHHSLDNMKELATNIMKANGPGVVYDIAKDAIQNMNACDPVQATNSVQSDIEEIMINHITQGSIMNTVTHIINHHHM